MRTVKGFIEITALASNVQGEIGEFGELSTYASTFSRNKGYYSNATQTDVNLVTFKSVNDSNLYMVLSNTIRDHVLQIAQWVHDEYVGENIPLNTNLATFITNIETEFPTITDVAVGELIESTQGPTFNMPDYVQWQFNDGSNDYTFKIWFSDASFRTQYDEYEIMVIPPVDGDLDDLNTTFVGVASVLADFTTVEKFEQAQLIQAGNPATIVKAINLVWHDPSDAQLVRDTDWVIVIYGPMGDNIDLIYQTIQDYITANTTLLTAVWVSIYPALYEQTEFIIIPLWDHVASPQTLLNYGIYSPTINPADIRDIAVIFTPSQYDEEYNLSNHLDTNINVAATYFRSLSFIAVANPANAAGLLTFKLAYPDYMNVPPSNVADFARMESETQSLVLLLVDMFEKALDLTPSSVTPPGYTKVTRNNILYLAKEHTDEVTYLVVSKHSYDANI